MKPFEAFKQEVRDAHDKQKGARPILVTDMVAQIAAAKKAAEDKAKKESEPK